MIAYLCKRILQAVFVILVVSLCVAYAIRQTGDPALMLTQESSSLTLADLERIRQALGTDQPFAVQYLRFLHGMLKFDWGRSFQNHAPVGPMLTRALPATLALAMASLLLSLCASIPLGIHAAVRQGGIADQLIRVLSLLGLSFPNFWLAMMFILLFSIGLQWLPPSGMHGPLSLLMPSLTLAIILTASTVRLVRATMLEVLHTHYIQTARAKGVSERVVLYRHALRNCAIPLTTHIGLHFGSMLGGIVVIERVFNWPGLGTLAFDAVGARDYPVLQAVVIVLSMMIVLINLLTDLLYGWFDPRVRLS